jgi:hypothetical protein
VGVPARKWWILSKREENYLANDSLRSRKRFKLKRAFLFIDGWRINYDEIAAKVDKCFQKLCSTYNLTSQGDACAYKPMLIPQYIYLNIYINVLIQPSK